MAVLKKKSRSGAFSPFLVLHFFQTRAEMQPNWEERRGEEFSDCNKTHLPGLSALFGRHLTYWSRSMTIGSSEPGIRRRGGRRVVVLYPLRCFWTEKGKKCGNKAEKGTNGSL